MWRLEMRLKERNRRVDLFKLRLCGGVAWAV